MPRLSSDRIAAAARRIAPEFRDTPQYDCESLSQALGCQLTVKVEVMNPIRSFKGRGADHFMAGIAPGSRLITASAGNLGQAMAYAARARGVALTVYASIAANPLKIERMRAFGADVILTGADFDAAKLAAKAAAATQGLRMVEDGRDPELAEGAGTIAVELLRAPGGFDAVLVPLGNGALLGGVARFLTDHAPAIQVIGVSAAGAPSMERSWRSGAPVETPTIDTIADGLGTRIPIAEALDDLRGTIADIVAVSDPAMIEGMRLAHRHLGLVLEPSGAATLAAIQSDPARFRGARVAAILCGGNLTTDQMARWLA